MPQILKDQIIFDSTDWLAGLHPQFGSTNYGQKLVNGLQDSTSVDPFRRLGYMTPGYSPENGTHTSVIDAVAVAGVMGNSSKAYILAGAKIHEVAAASGNVTNAGSFPKTIAGTGPIGSDFVEYYVGATKYAFYSYSATTVWNVGRYDLSSTFNDTYMTATAASPLASPYTTDGAGFEHPMIVGDDNKLYIGDRNYLHSFDGQNGSDGTFTAARLTFSSGYIITSYAKLQPDTLVIFAYKQSGNSSSYAGEVMAFFYDYTSDRVYKKIKIRGNYVSTAFEYNGTIGCWVIGFNDRGISKESNLMIFDGQKFVNVASAIETIPKKNGVEVVGTVIYSNCGGTVYAYGNQVPSLQNGLHKVAAGASTSSGLLKTFFDGSCMLSSGTTTNGGLQVLSTTKYAAGSSFTTVLADPLFGKGTRGKVDGVRIEFGKSCSGGRGVEVLLYDRSGNPFPNITPDIQTVASSNLAFEYTQAQSGEWREFDAIKAQVNWTTGGGSSDAPVISRIIIYYKPISLTKKR